MFPLKVSEPDKLGVIYIKLNQPPNSDIENYFEGIKKLQPFLRSTDLESKLTGFYLNMWNKGGIRFSYFTDNSEQSADFLNSKFLSMNFENYLPKEKPHDAPFDYYLGKNKTNLEFRRFLQLITNIGLDSLKLNVIYSRILVAKYRLEIAPSGQNSRPYFESAFKKNPYYNSLDFETKNELFEGLDYWHTSWEDWAHMLVVMLLPGDWLYSFKQIFNPRRPINKFVRNALSRGLLPNNWQP
jgi:hypothetical protein